MTFFGNPVSWFATATQLRDGEGGSAITVIALLGLVAVSSLRLLSSPDMVVRLIQLEPLLPAFALLMAASLWWTFDIYLTARYAVLLIAGLAYAYYLVLRFEPIQILELLSIIGLFGVAANLFWIFALPEYGITAGATTWTGVFAQKNALGFVATLLIPSMVLLGKTRSRARWLARANVVGWAPMLLGSGSKTMLLATLISLALLVFYTGFRTRKTLRGAVIAALLGSSVVTVAFGTANLSFIADQLEKDVTLTGRTLLWESLLDPIQDSLFFGYGYSVAFSDPFGPLSQVLAVNSWGVAHAHNAFLQILLDAGAVGLLLYLAVFVRAVLRSIEVTRITRGPLGLWPLSFLSTVLLVSLSEPGVTGGGPGWLLLCLAVLYARILDRPDGPRHYFG